MTKLKQLTDAMDCGDWRKAFSIASHFTRLGSHEDAIRRGHEAMQRPEFYREIKRDPDELITIGIVALRERYSSHFCKGVSQGCKGAAVSRPHKYQKRRIYREYANLQTK